MVFSFVLFHQSIGQIPVNKLFGTYFTETGKTAVTLSDSTVYAFGTSSAQQDKSSQFYLLKTDSALNYKWSKFYGSSGVDDGADMYYNTDSSYIYMIGNSYINATKTYDIKLIKTDSSGTIIFEKNFGTNNWDFCKKIIPLANGNLAICGYTYGSSYGLADAFVLLTNYKGDSLGMFITGDAYDNFFLDIVQRSSDTLVMVGEWGSSTGLKKGVISEFDLNTQTFSTSSYNSGFNFSFNAIALNLDGNYFISADNDSTGGGGANGSGMVFHKNSHTKILEMFIGAPLDEYCFDVKYFNNSYRILCQTYSFGLGNGDMIYHQFDNGGWWITGRTFGDAYTNEMNAMVFNQNNSLLFVGTSVYNFGASDLWIVNLDSNYNATATISSELDPNYIDETNSFTNNQLKIYPNPFNNKFQVSTDEIPETVFVKDINGKIIQTANKTKWINAQEISVGVYLLEVHFKNSIQSIPIIKTN